MVDFDALACARTGRRVADRREKTKKKLARVGTPRARGVRLHRAPERRAELRVVEPPQQGRQRRLDLRGRRRAERGRQELHPVVLLGAAPLPPRPRAHGDGALPELGRARAAPGRERGHQRPQERLGRVAPPGRQVAPERVGGVLERRLGAVDRGEGRRQFGELRLAGLARRGAPRVVGRVGGRRRGPHDVRHERRVLDAQRDDQRELPARRRQRVAAVAGAALGPLARGRLEPRAREGHDRLPQRRVGPQLVRRQADGLLPHLGRDVRPPRQLQRAPQAPVPRRRAPRGHVPQRAQPERHVVRRLAQVPEERDRRVREPGGAQGRLREELALLRVQPVPERPEERQQAAVVGVAGRAALLARVEFEQHPQPELQAVPPALLVGHGPAQDARHALRLVAGLAAREARDDRVPRLEPLLAGDGLGRRGEAARRRALAQPGPVRVGDGGRRRPGAPRARHEPPRRLRGQRAVVLGGLRGRRHLEVLLLDLHGVVAHVVVVDAELALPARPRVPPPLLRRGLLALEGLALPRAPQRVVGGPAELFASKRRFQLVGGRGDRACAGAGASRRVPGTRDAPRAAPGRRPRGAAPVDDRVRSSSAAWRARHAARLCDESFSRAARMAATSSRWHLANCRPSAAAAASRAAASPVSARAASAAASAFVAFEGRFPSAAASRTSSATTAASAASRCASDWTASSLPVAVRRCDGSTALRRRSRLASSTVAAANRSSPSSLAAPRSAAAATGSFSSTASTQHVASAVDAHSSVTCNFPLATTASTNSTTALRTFAERSAA